MHGSAVVIYAWTTISIGWIIFDLITDPEAWLNFTSWVWTLQSIFFLIYALILNNFFDKVQKDKWKNFLDTIFLPVLFSCEWTTAISVVYMMVSRADMMHNSVETYGAIVANIGSFIVHYLTLVMLLFYIYLLKPIREPPPPTQFLLIVVFFIFYCYMLVQEPATHYGIKNTSNLEAEIGMIVTSLIGVLVFQNLPTNFDA
jgi:hypothetical protein